VLFVGADQTPPVRRVPPAFADAAPAADAQRAAPAGLTFGLLISVFEHGAEPTAHRLADLARAAEDAGFTSLWVMDHFIQIPQVGRAWDAMLESYTTLSYLAGVTERIRLGTLVTAAGYRNPAHLGKIVATLDVLSGGRAICGLGAGWYEKEARAYGYDFPAAPERLDLLEDVLRLLPMMWGPGSPAFEGTVISVPDTTCYPRPIQEHIPILVGGQGEKRTLRLVAELADMCNLSGDSATVRRKLEVLERHCAAAGRDPAEITVTHLGPATVAPGPEEAATIGKRLTPAGRSPDDTAAALNLATVEDHVGRFRTLADAGVHHAIVHLGETTAEAVRAMAPVIAAFAPGPRDEEAP
jgi:F420-dependent oxidoreductase-like protein